MHLRRLLASALNSPKMDRGVAWKQFACRVFENNKISQFQNNKLCDIDEFKD